MQQRIVIGILIVLIAQTTAVAGGVKGKAAFAGKPFRGEKIDMGGEPSCALKQQKDKNTPRFENVVMSREGDLQNVVVYVKEGLPEKKWDVPTDPILVNQEGCQYKPHVFTMMAGQPITIRNSDGLLHNIHAVPEKNPQFNISQPKSGDKTDSFFDVAEVGIKIKCDVHPWMGAYACVFDHPYHTVTGKGGTYEIADLPSGEYTIAAWHEEFGEKTQEVTVGDDLVVVDFSFEKK